MVDAEVVGNIIRTLREERGLSQEVLSGFAAIGRTHLSMIERGERKPTLETIFRLANALSMKPSQLVREIEVALGERMPSPRKQEREKDQ
jgi:transcriptional regulator with XRE-family HTH domain